MPILIDGHNVIGKLPTLSLQDPDDEEKLVRRLVAYAARVGKAITVVFDPGELSPLWEAQRHGGVEVVFAPRGRSADQVIARRVERSRNAREWLVITSDQQLADHVLRLGARLRSAESFVAELETAEARPERRDMPLSADEVDDWLAVFGTQKRSKGERS